ncbi:hypothetical protein niasHT_007992 [Heterodera trifolii]|uniref:Uncoordinated protein 79 n=1 Tax=Heterodera trifolii TaxID=157864 RepID=A0ABD2M1P5_9BILA
MSKLYYPPPNWKPKPSKKSAGHSTVMATTRAATFSAKIRTLSDFHSRIVCQQQPPSSAEIVTTLRYFQQTLVGFLKELPAKRSELFEEFSAENTTVRTGLYPNLNYSGLFYGITNLLDAFPMLSSAHNDIAEAILDTLKALYFFIDRDCVDQMPLLLAAQLGVFPAEMDRRLVHLLCDCILPYSFGEGANGRVSVPAVLMLILHHPTDPSIHTMAVESLMRTLPDIYNDLVTIIASGTSESRIVAANLLFHYWPLMNPAILHRKSIQYKIHVWSPPPCQNIGCAEHGKSTRLTFEPALCALLGDTSPPLVLCDRCADSCQAEMPMRFLCQPLPVLISATCQLKGCQSSSRIAVSTCFDEDCIRSHGHVPLRLCHECSVHLHAPPVRAHRCHFGPGTIWGTPLEHTMAEAVVKLLRETSANLVSSSDGEAAKRPKWLRQLESGRELGREVDALSDERRMLSRFGIWLMAAHCPPVAEATQDSIGYLLSALFQWFATTALLPNDAMGQSLEQLKSDFACEWLNQTLATHYDEFVTQLLPQQLEPSAAAEDAIWDMRAIRREQFRDGLGKLLALAPYDVVSLSTWSRVMPAWLHALNTELLDEVELLELKVPLSKLFEPDLCPLPFEAHRLFEFIAVRLNDVYDEVLKAIDWLHLLTRIDIRISLDLLLEVFSSSLQRLPAPLPASVQFDQSATEPSQPMGEGGGGIDNNSTKEEKTDGEREEDETKRETDDERGTPPPPTGPLAVQLIMTDILAQQITLAGGPSALNEQNTERLFSVIARLFRYHSETVLEEQGWAHNCQKADSDQFVDCIRCQQALFLYQVIHQMLEQFCPKEDVRAGFFPLADEAAREFADWLSETSSSVHQNVASASSRRSPSPRALSSSSPAGTKFFASPSIQRRQQQQLQSVGKAMQEASTPAEQLASALPAEEVESARAQAAMTIAEQSPLGMACVSATFVESGDTMSHPSTNDMAGVSDANGGGDGEEKVPKCKNQGAESVGERLFWDTSVGRFRFSLVQMPAQLQLIYGLLMNVEREPDPDVQYFLLCLLKYLCLSRECLSNARKEQEHRGFLVWLQENLLISRLWTLLRSDFSHVGQMAVPLLLHAITLPLGEDVFWEIVNKEFTSDEWQCRLKAVDRVLVLAHFVPVGPVRSNQSLLTALSCAFSHLIVSVYDPNPAVAQKALLSLESLPRQSLLLICQCLEAQFDSCILDRPLIISRLHLLGSFLPEECLYSWDFFIQRFETLALEAQLRAQQKAGADTEGQFVQDLHHSDPMSELYQRKVTRARQSLNEADSVRSIVRSLRENSLRHQLNAPGAKGDQVTDITHQHPFHAILSPAASSIHSSTNDGRYGRMREFTDEESNLCLLLNRVVDMQNSERHTVFLVVSLFVHFLASKRCGPAENAKKQSVLLRHFNTLLGYSNSDKCFTIPPARLRRAAVCNAFLYGLPEVLDSNLLMGNQLLSIVLQLLLYLPSPQKFASDAPSADYSLRLLSSQQQHCWLHSLITILYKYRCDATSVSDCVRKLMLIVVQTVEQQCHRCPAPGDPQQPQQIIPPDKERRSAAIPSLMEPGEWSSSGGETAGSGDEFGGAEQRERLLTLVDEEGTPAGEGGTTDEKSERRVPGAGRVAQPHPQRPESLKIGRHGGSGRMDNGKSRRTMAGYDPISELQPSCSSRPPVIALHPPPSRSRHRSGGNAVLGSCRSSTTQTPRRPPVERLVCGHCGARIECFNEETLSLCCVALCTFLQRATALAAPLLPRTLRCVTRFIDSPLFPWHESNVFVPGNSCSAAKQLIRVIMHQLSSSGIALQLFSMHIQANELNQFWNRIANALADFSELNPVAFIQILLEDMLEAWPLRVTRILHNLAIFIQFILPDAFANWALVVGQLEGLFRRLQSQLSIDLPGQNGNNNCQTQQNLAAEVSSSVLVMSRVMRVQNFASIKGAAQLVESFAKWLVEMLHRCPVELRDMLLVCTACNRGMIRERDKQIMTRAIVGELVAALKFKCELVEPNHLAIVRLVLQDFGEPLDGDWTASQCGQMAETTEGNGLKEDGRSTSGAELIGGTASGNGSSGDQFNTGAAEAIRPHVPELLEFIADLHVLAKMKKQTLSSSDRMGGDLKAGLAELIALEMSRPSVRDSRTVMRFIPWLYSPPSLAQALPGAFAESVANVRVLSWILLGALHARGNGTVNAICSSVSGPNQCLPVPIACSGQMADYIHFVLAGFADQSKQSVVHMSALFHAFHLCQLWTIYCEQTAATCRSEETLQRTMQQILDFWARVTPAILQLLSHSKVLADMVNLHFVNTLQALQQVNSAVLCQLYPMWEPVLTAHHAHIPRQLRMKLDAVEAQLPLETPQMRPWLSKVRYKISQIELQTSAASPFYNV